MVLYKVLLIVCLFVLSSCATEPVVVDLTSDKVVIQHSVNTPAHLIKNKALPSL